MKCFTKKILCYIICGLLTFSLTSTVYYKSVHAMEWVGGALAFEEALKWLLACIGITATAGMTDAYWDAYGDDFTDYAIENGATQTEVAEWQLKACEGVIDKGSEVWTKFKSWASELVSGDSSGSGSGSGSIGVGPYTATEICNFYSSGLGANYNVNSNVSDISNNIYAAVLWHIGTSTIIEMFPTSGVYSFGANNNVYCDNNDRLSYYEISLSNNSWNLNRSSIGTNSCYFDTFTFNGVNGGSFCIGFNGVNLGNKARNFIETSSGGVADDNFESVTTNVNDLDVISSDGVDEDNPEVRIPIPGVSDSDNEASKDSYDEIIDAINDGTITQEQGLEQIQEILKIITYDTVTDKVVPPQVDPDTGEDKTKDDVLKENKENMGFTLGGLETVFPFCIPFDIYAFMTLLVAEPECPEFDFPIKSVNGEVEEIHVDLEPFEPVAVVVRYCFDFLFIIGLALLTRSLIGGGSSD